MTENDGERRLVLCDRQQTLVDHYLTTRHTPCVDTLILYEIELPLISVELTCRTILLEICLYGISQSLTDTQYHLSISLVGRLLGCLHVLGILLGTQAEHLLVADHQCLFATRDGYCARCAARG